MITLYAVTWRADAPVLDEDGLALLADGDLAMVVGPAQGTASRDDALAHGRIVEQVASAADVLPIRYGATAADTDEARALLREHGSAWAARLQKVEGCAEIAIRAAPPAADERSAPSRERSTWPAWSPGPGFSTAPRASSASCSPAAAGSCAGSPATRSSG